MAAEGRHRMTERSERTERSEGHEGMRKAGTA
jgi:hypothetical protein